MKNNNLTTDVQFDTGFLLFANRASAIILVAMAVFLIGCNSDSGTSADSSSGESNTNSDPAETDAANTASTDTADTDTASADPGVRSATRPKLAFVTNGIANFWKIAEAGALQAGEDFNCDVEVKMPPSEGGRAANQKRMLQQLISKGIEGVAVSPVDPANQTDILNEVGNNAVFITHDSDAPETNRRVYIGMSNYDAGRMAGELVKTAIPDGGNIVIFIGSLEQHNAKLRRQGLIDEVLGRDHNPDRYDQPGSPIGDEKYTFLATRVDDFNDTRKKELPEQALAKFDKIDCMVGLFEYNPPFIFDALESKGELGKIKVVGFDENERTLEEIKNGNCEGTVVQNPYMYGYRSIEVLSRLVAGDESDLTSDFMDIPAEKITIENAQEFQDTLAARIAGEDVATSKK